MNTSPASVTLNHEPARRAPHRISAPDPERSGLTIFASCDESAHEPATQDCGTGFFAEFRRKLASGEAFSRAVVKLAEALRFTGRITISFHQGRVTKTVLDESYFSGG